MAPIFWAIVAALALAKWSGAFQISWADLYAWIWVPMGLSAILGLLIAMGLAGLSFAIIINLAWVVFITINSWFGGTLGFYDLYYYLAEIGWCILLPIALAVMFVKSLF